jgi:hypothetical protein
MSAAIDKQIRKLQAGWACKNARIFSAGCVQMLCGYYYDSVPGRYYVGWFQTPLFQTWDDRILGIRADRLPFDEHIIRKPMPPRDVACAIKNVIDKDGGEHFAEPTLQEFIGSLDEIFGDREPIKVSEAKLLSYLMLNEMETAKMQLHRHVERFWNGMQKADKDELRDFIALVNKDSATLQKKLNSHIAMNKQLLGIP